MEPVTENPAVGATEVWEIYNTTADAHPMHIHEVTFEVVNRQDIVIDEETETVAGRSGSTPTPARSRGRTASRTRSSPTPARSPGSERSSTRPASSSGTATSSSTRTTR